LTLAEV